MLAEKIYTAGTTFLSNCINSCISLVKILLSFHFRIQLPRAIADSCIILGNGPSLKQSLQKHPDFFKKYPLVCVNGFSLSNEYQELKPAYYVMLDPAFWLNTDENIKRIFDTIIQKTTWNLHLLIPSKARKFPIIQQLEKSNPNIRIGFYNYTVFRGFTGISHFFYKRNMAMPQSQNVLVASLFICINMQFKNIYIVGADHTWHESMHVNEQNQLMVKHLHFFNNEETVSYVPFYRDEHKIETFRVDELFYTMAKVFSGYRAIKKYGDLRQTNIYNCSEISFIDDFERRKID
jgi:hypothetical protein